MKRQKLVTLSLATTLALTGVLHPMMSTAKHSVEKDIKQLAALVATTEKSYAQLLKVSATVKHIAQLTLTYKQLQSVQQHIKTHRLTKKQAKTLKVSTTKLAKIKQHVEQVIALQQKLAAVQSQSRMLLLATQDSIVATDDQYRIWALRWNDLTDKRSDAMLKIIKNVLRNDSNTMKATFIHAIELASQEKVTGDTLSFIEETLAILDESAYKKAKKKWLMKQKSLVAATSRDERQPTVFDYEGMEKEQLVVVSEPGQYVTVSNVNVTGTVIVKGGGNVTFAQSTIQQLQVDDVAENSLHLVDVDVQNVVVNDPNGARLVTGGKTAIRELTVNGNVKIEATDVTKIASIQANRGAGVVAIAGPFAIQELKATGEQLTLSAIGSEVTIAQVTASGGALTLQGQLPKTNVVIDSNKAKVTVGKRAEIGEISKTSNVTTTVQVSNEGKINKVDASIEVSGNPPTIQPKPPVIEPPVIVQPIPIIELKVAEAKLANDTIAIAYTNVATPALTAKFILEQTKVIRAGQKVPLPAETIVTILANEVQLKLPLAWTGDFQLELPKTMANGVTTLGTTSTFTGAKTLTLTSDFNGVEATPFIIYGDLVVAETVKQLANVIVHGNVTMANSATKLSNVDIDGELTINGESDPIQGDMIATLLTGQMMQNSANEIVIPYVPNPWFTLTEQHVRAAVQQKVGKEWQPLPQGTVIAISETMIVIQTPTPIGTSSTWLIAEQISQDGAMSWPVEKVLP